MLCPPYALLEHTCPHETDRNRVRRAQVYRLYPVLPSVLGGGRFRDRSLPGDGQLHNGHIRNKRVAIGYIINPRIATEAVSTDDPDADRGLLLRHPLGAGAMARRSIRTSPTAGFAGWGSTAQSPITQPSRRTATAGFVRAICWGVCSRAYCRAALPRSLVGGEGFAVDASLIQADASDRTRVAVPRVCRRRRRVAPSRNISQCSTMQRSVRQAR
jgi:hypothetical protein